MWFDEYDNTPVKVDNNKYEDYDDQSEHDEYTYDDILELVKSVNSGSFTDLQMLQEIVADIITDFEIEKEEIDIMIEDLWENEMEKFITFDCYTVFNDDIARIKQGFFTWIYKHNDRIQKLNYLIDLNDAISSYLQ